MTSYRYDDWSELAGTFVEVRINNQCLRSAYVDEAMPDSSALWPAADELDDRALIAKVEGYEIWVEFGDLGGVGLPHQFLSTAP